MHPRSLFRRRPSAPVVISLTALFLSLGGVGWAATQLPSNSVGTGQLQNGSVTNFKLAQEAVGFRKIIPGSVGTRRINQNQVQIRVNGTCSGANAIASITRSGGVGCVPVAPNQIGTVSSGQVTVAPGNTNTTVASETLPASTSFVVFGTVNATVTTSTATDQWVKLTCTLNPGGTGNTRTASATVHVTSADPESVNIPIVAPTGASSGNTTANVTCTFANSPTTPSPTVAANASLNAITTAANS
jgi:hypothetical protein